VARRPRERDRRRATFATACCAVAVAASVAFAVTSSTADAEGGRAGPHGDARILADAALANALVPIATPEGLARDPQGRAMTTHYSIETRRARESALREKEQRTAALFAAAVARAARERRANEAVWDRLARCETGGNWHMRGSRFSGGLGIHNGTWSAFGGRRFASNAGLATREQQIIVAERIRARYGYTGWGCAPKVGLGRTTMH
jgi:hypothetical protein